MLSLEKIGLHSSASTEMIAGDRPEVKRLVKLVTALILEDPCLMVVHSVLSNSQASSEIVFQCILCIKCRSIRAVVTRLSIRSIALVPHNGISVLRALYSATQRISHVQYDAVYRRFGGTCCVPHQCRSVSVAARRPQWSRQRCSEI